MNYQHFENCKRTSKSRTLTGIVFKPWHCLQVGDIPEHEAFTALV